MKNGKKTTQKLKVDNGGRKRHKGRQGPSFMFLSGGLCL